MLGALVVATHNEHVLYPPEELLLGFLDGPAYTSTCMRSTKEKRVYPDIMELAQDALGNKERLCKSISLILPRPRPSTPVALGDQQALVILAQHANSIVTCQAV